MRCGGEKKEEGVERRSGGMCAVHDRQWQRQLGYLVTLQLASQRCRFEAYECDCTSMEDTTDMGNLA